MNFIFRTREEIFKMTKYVFMRDRGGKRYVMEYTGDLREFVTSIENLFLVEITVVVPLTKEEYDQWD